jgi:hypothetical protein
LDWFADVSDVLTVTIFKENLTTQLALYVLGTITPVTGFTVLLEFCESRKSSRTNFFNKYSVLSGVTDLVLILLRKWHEGN